MTPDELAARSSQIRQPELEPPATRHAPISKLGCALINATSMPPEPRTVSRRTRGTASTTSLRRTRLSLRAALSWRAGSPVVAAGNYGTKEGSR